MALSKVISGGQTGADQAGLEAAALLRIPTGGWLPKRCVTQSGPAPHLVEIYGMQEHPDPGYRARTRANVRDSDGTIRLAFNFNSPGELCTLRAIKDFKRPYFDVDLKDPRPVGYAAEWIRRNKIEVLNVAGNSESTHVGTFRATLAYLTKLFRILRENG